MNFINHSQHMTLDSGDATACIEKGIEVARALLKVDWATCTIERDITETAAAPMRAWINAAQDLLDVTRGIDVSVPRKVYVVTLVAGIPDTVTRFTELVQTHGGDLLNDWLTNDGWQCIALSVRLTPEELRCHLRVYLGSRRYMTIDVLSGEQLAFLRARGLA